MGKALYRTYRPSTLDEIVGQDHITRLLKQTIAADAVSHAYLLTGPRGVGKTSIARIIAHEINGLTYNDESSHLDIIEIDAASNNGVEDVRDLREKLHIAPSSAKKKVYIIDEVHMLSKAAFNALLKTLEEPPAHVVFILATTDVEKLPQTIISRVQRFNFRTIPKKEVMDQLKTIAKKESIKIDNGALLRIAEYGDGSFRDSIGLLDQLKDSVAPDTITIDTVNQTLGATDAQTITELLEATSAQSLTTIVKTLGNLESNGISAKTVKGQLIDAIANTIENNPSNLGLLDRLTKLTLSQYPYLRLLIALSSGINSQATTQVVAKKPTVKASTVASKSIETNKKKFSLDTDSPKPIKKQGPDEESHQKQELGTKPKSQVARKPLSDFSWSALIDLVKKEALATATMLSQSEYELHDSTITIYAKQAFRAKRLQSQKYSATIDQALEALGFHVLEVEVLPGAKPATDSSVTAVTDIMGGGEEVKI